ncbi:MAG: cupin domain-containing protein [Nanoarchaeota archaeon]|nr:cupin domain-containing protein [Nanoarchaeota archaeon]
MKNKDIRKLISYSENGIVSKVIIKTDKLNVTLFCMAAGSDMDEHTSTKEGLVYVIEGKGIFNLQGKNIQMLPETLIHMEKSAVHSLKAEQNTSFILYLFS